MNTILTKQPMENGLFSRVLRPKEFEQIRLESMRKKHVVTCDCDEYRDGKYRVYRVYGRISGDGHGSPFKVKYKNQIARCSHMAYYSVKTPGRPPKSLDITFIRFSKIKTKNRKTK